MKKTLRILNGFIFGPRPKPSPGIPAPPFLPSPEVQKLEIDHFRDWIAHHAKRKDLPIYTLVPEAPPLDLTSGASAFRPLYSLQRISASGLWRVFVGPSPAMGFEAASSSGFDAIRDAGLGLDQRGEGPHTGIDSTLIVRSARSRLEQHGLPVLGPGGHVTAYRRGAQLEVDVVVRKRFAALIATPRSAEDIAESFGRRITGLSPGGPEPRIWGGFGYFELSKYERQLHMRPAFVVTVSFSDEQGSILWNSTLVEPASVKPGIPDTEGLGSWAI